MDQMVWTEDHGYLKKIGYGKEKFLITEYPVELNTNLNSIATLYKYAQKEAGLAPAFTTDCKNPGILIRPVDYEKARLYLLESETDKDENIIIYDKLVNKTFTITLRARRAKLLLISSQDGKIPGEY
jgi:hypothetical protein